MIDGEPEAGPAPPRRWRGTARRLIGSGELFTGGRAGHGDRAENVEVQSREPCTGAGLTYGVGDVLVRRGPWSTSSVADSQSTLVDPSADRRAVHPMPRSAEGAKPFPLHSWYLTTPVSWLPARLGRNSRAGAREDAAAHRVFCGDAVPLHFRRIRHRERPSILRCVASALDEPRTYQNQVADPLERSVSVGASLR